MNNRKRKPVNEFLCFMFTIFITMIFKMSFKKRSILALTLLLVAMRHYSLPWFNLSAFDNQLKLDYLPLVLLFPDDRSLCWQRSIGP